MNTQSILKVAVVGLLGMACTSYAAEGTWMRKADMPTTRMGLSTSVVDGKIYAIGGGTSLYAGAFSTAEEYDPATNSWIKKADMPGVRYMHSAAVVNGKIYIIGGATGPQITVPTVQEYDPAMDTWTKKADMPTSRCFLSACVVNDKIYAIGGRIYPDMLNVSTVEEYDPATDTWTRRTDMPAPRVCFSVSAVNGKIYAIGGGWYDALSVMEEYDPATDTWIKKADKPTAGKLVSTSVVNGKIYAIGGATGGFGPLSSAVEEYDPATDTWTTKADMPTARWFHSTSAVNGKIYAIGGDATGSRTSAISTVEEYDLTPPPPDFNSDEIVDIQDLLIMIEYWGQDEPSVDIAPPPFGDGIIDVKDLEVLMSYWEQSVDDPTLVAHWAMDETEGDIAYDSAGVNDAFIVGGTTWQPRSGKVDGAIQFNGVDGCAIANPVLNPAGGPFSVFAWIQGGAPGQVVISQLDGANWLGLDPSWGCLMTELKSSGRGGVPTQSEVVITDGAWHRIGFVWNGLYRVLYVDDIPVVEDTQANLQGSDNGLYIGTGKAMGPGTYWSGLIDEVRIYNRAINP